MHAHTHACIHLATWSLSCYGPSHQKHVVNTWSHHSAALSSWPRKKRIVIRTNIKKDPLRRLWVIFRCCSQTLQANITLCLSNSQSAEIEEVEQVGNWFPVSCFIRPQIIKNTERARTFSSTPSVYYIYTINAHTLLHITWYLQE